MNSGNKRISGRYISNAQSKKITSPVLIFQDLNDPKVHYKESEQIFHLINEQGRTLWFVIARDEGHGFRKSNDQKLQRDIEIAFLNEYLLKGVNFPKKRCFFGNNGLRKTLETIRNGNYTSLSFYVTDELSDLTKSMTTSKVTKFGYDKFPWQDVELTVVENLVFSRVALLLKTKECGIIEPPPIKEQDFNSLYPFAYEIEKTGIEIIL